MFMKRKTRKPENAYAYRMLLSFKTSVTYIKKNLLHAESCVHCEAVFIVHDSIFFAGHCPMSNMHACNHSADLYYMAHSSYRIVQSSYYITHSYYTGILFQRYVHKNLLHA